MHKIKNFISDSNAAQNTQTITSEPPTEEMNFESIFSFLPFVKNRKKPVVAVLRLSGIIGKVSMKSGLVLENINDLIEKTFNIPRLSAVCLVVNSPGGSPVQSELIAKRIMDLSEEKKISVYGFVEDIAASGGYWLACAAQEIYALPTSIIGSIGVVSSGFGFHEVISKLGIERRVYTEGKNKSILDPFQPVKEEDLRILRNLQQQVHAHFVSYVKSRRGNKLTQSDDILFNGEFWAGKSALDFGLIDGISDMYGFIKDKFGDDIKIEYIAAKQSWLKKKLSLDSRIIGRYFAEDFACANLDALDEKINTKILSSRFDL